MKQRILFLYLDTGGGHIAPARVLKKALETQYPGSVSAELLNGFGPRQRISHIFFETGYELSCNYMPPAYSLFYDLTTLPPALHCTKALCSWFTVSYLADYIRAHQITKVVSFHFAVSPAALRAVRRIHPRIPFLVVITDPFSAHPAWFLVRDQRYIVFSESLKEDIIERYGMKSEQLEVMPFVVDPAFSPAEAVQGIAASGKAGALRAKYGIPAEKKTVLITGGREGLPNSFRLVSFLAGMRPDFSIAVVCGHNTRLQRRLESLKCHLEAEGLAPDCIRIFGYVTFMSDLIRLSDCVVTKAGASTIMEVLSCRKPIICSTYIHGQELANVRFITENGAGWFIRSPSAIYETIMHLFTDEDFNKHVLDNILRLPLNKHSAQRNLSRITSYIHDFPEV